MGVSTVTIKPVCLIVGFICLAKFRRGKIYCFQGCSGKLVFVFGYDCRCQILGCVLGSLVSVFGDDFCFHFLHF